MIKKRTILFIGMIVMSIVMVTPAAVPAGDMGDDDILGREVRGDPGAEQFRNTDLPTALYSMLVEDYGFLKERRFKGSLTALRITAVPKALRLPGSRGYRLLAASTLRKGYRVYVIIPTVDVKYFSGKIRKRERVYITYTPYGVYGGAPVLKLDGKIGVEEKVEKGVISGAMARYYPAKEGDEWKVIIGNNLRVLNYKIDEIKGSTARGSVRETTPGGTEPDKVNTLLIIYDNTSITVIEGGTDSMGQQFKSSDLVLKAPLKIGTRWDARKEDQVKKREIVAVNTSVEIDGRQFGDVLVVREDSIIKVDEQKRYYAATYYFYSGGVGFIGCKITAADTPESIKTHENIDDWFIKRSD
ncbi:MAG TPA: hypothetical protein ENN21_01220 [Spirochaetes bacterium]|nr:hypothetical protein [Spirochaetota bacterium]